VTTIINETRERFLLAIGAQIPADQIEEIHFFSPIKQGGVESGVAVVAARALIADRSSLIDPAGSEDAAEAGELDQRSATSDQRPQRLVIYTARYRLTLKGPDRGKWETNVVAEADAPLVTVDAVVRGVQRRSGDVDDPAKMEGDDARAILEAKQPSS
jgi:hypothetical protein